MEALAWLVVVLAGYLPGSLPAGLLAGRLKGVDIRAVGSGNIGATNAFRVLGKGIGVAVLLVDVMKGLLPCLFLPALVAGVFPESQAPELPTLHMLIGVSAILGHNYPCWLGFKGGKGIATTAGVVGGLAPMPFGICIGAVDCFFRGQPLRVGGVDRGGGCAAGQRCGVAGRGGRPLRVAVLDFPVPRCDGDLEASDKHSTAHERHRASRVGRTKNLQLNSGLLKKHPGVHPHPASGHLLPRGRARKIVKNCSTLLIRRTYEWRQ